jgi:hypothetical protein
MRGSSRKSAEHLTALDRITEQTRERFALQADEVIMVTQASLLGAGLYAAQDSDDFLKSERHAP